MEQLNFNRYIWRDGYSNAIYIQNTMMMQIGEVYIDYIPEELMRNTIRDVYRKVRAGYDGQRRMARTSHVQLSAIYRKNLAFILDSLQNERRMTEELYEEEAKKIRDALEQSRAIEAECARIAEEEQRMRSGGNIRFHKKPRTTTS